MAGLEAIMGGLAGGAGGGAAAANPLAGIATAVLGGLFGKKKSSGGGVDSRTKKTYDRRFAIAQGTDLDALIEKSIAARRDIEQTQALDALQKYDAIQAGRGSPVFSSDSRKDSARALIADKAGRSTAQYAADLILKSPWMKQSLYPDLQGGVVTPVTQSGVDPNAMIALGPMLGQWLQSIFR